MGVSPLHDVRRHGGGRIDATVKALTSKKRRKELGHAAKQELNKAKKNLSENLASRQFWSKLAKLFLMIAFYFTSSIALTFYQKQLIVVSLDSNKFVRFFEHSPVVLYFCCVPLIWFIRNSSNSPCNVLYSILT